MSSYLYMLMRYCFLQESLHDYNNVVVVCKVNTCQYILVLRVFVITFDVSNARVFFEELSIYVTVLLIEFWVTSFNNQV